MFVFYSHLKYSYYEQSLAVAISTSAVKTTCRMFASLPPCLRLSSSTVWRHNRKYANWPVRLDNGYKKKFVKQSNVNMAAAAKTEKYSYMGCIIHICKLCWRRKKKNVIHGQSQITPCTRISTKQKKNARAPSVKSADDTSTIPTWKTETSLSYWFICI